jgi:large subunit ribosomal protein L19
MARAGPNRDERPDTEFQTSEVTKTAEVWPVKKGRTMSHQIMKLVERSSMKEEVPTFSIGDTVDVHCRILEGDKERVQVFTGVVIARSGSGTREMFTVRRIVQSEGVERKFPLHSPKIAKIVVKRSAVVRRAKLYYLRDRVGKAVRLRERRTDQKTKVKPARKSKSQ